jgi:hypothetical protein
MQNTSVSELVHTAAYKVCTCAGLACYTTVCYCLSRLSYAHVPHVQGKVVAHLQASANCAGALRAPAPDRRAQSEGAVVGQRHGMVIVLGCTRAGDTVT